MYSIFIPSQSDASRKCVEKTRAPGYAHTVRMRQSPIMDRAKRNVFLVSRNGSIVPRIVTEASTVPFKAREREKSMEGRCVSYASVRSGTGFQASYTYAYIHTRVHTFCPVNRHRVQRFESTFRPNEIAFEARYFVLPGVLQSFNVNPVRRWCRTCDHVWRHLPFVTRVERNRETEWKIEWKGW